LPLSRQQSPAVGAAPITISICDSSNSQKPRLTTTVTSDIDGFVPGLTEVAAGYLVRYFDASGKRFQKRLQATGDSQFLMSASLCASQTSSMANCDIEALACDETDRTVFNYSGYCTAAGAVHRVCNLLKLVNRDLRASQSKNDVGGAIVSLAT
jgi:hypothetical protein